MIIQNGEPIPTVPESAWRPSPEALPYWYDADGIEVEMNWFHVPCWLIYCDGGEVVVRWERIAENDSSMKASYSLAFYPYKRGTRRVRGKPAFQPRVDASDNRKPGKGVDPGIVDTVAITQRIRAYGWQLLSMAAEPR